MDDCSSADILSFDGFRFDRRRGGCLFRLDEGNVAEPVPLCGRGLALLGLLLERHGELVPKDEIMSVIWRGRVVEEANLNVQIAKLRHILDQNRKHGSCIQTITGHGYRFVAAVTQPETGTPSAIPVIFHDGALRRPRLSIVVLPFADLSENRKQYFADGITEDLTTDLSRIEDMFVISRSTAFSYRNKPIDLKQVGRELSVGYVLEGSVRRSGDKVRVNVQLIDAETDAHVWAERFDSNSGDLFVVQNEITSRIVVALERAAAELAEARLSSADARCSSIIRLKAA
jgi:TolB-like protein